LTIELEVGVSLDAAEKALILATLEANSGDKKKAAEILGVSLKTIYTRCKEYGVGRKNAAVTEPAEVQA
jgi:two-component system, NtrC family, response regulator AtoC